MRLSKRASERERESESERLNERVNGLNEANSSETPTRRDCDCDVRPTKMFVFRTGFVRPALPTPTRREEEEQQQQAGLGPGGLSVHNIFFVVGRGCSSAAAAATSTATATTAAAAGQGSHISWDNYYNNNDSV